MEKKEMDKFKEFVVKDVAKLIGWFISAGFIYWGWTVIAPHLNAPEFGYWEIFAIRMALGSIVKLFNFK